MSNYLRSCGLHHARLPCPSPSPRACSNSCPLSQRCHPTILSSVVPFFSCFLSFPASGSFPISQFFASGGKNYCSFSFSISPFLPMNIQDWFPLGWIGLISLQAKGFSRVFSSTTIHKASIFWCLAFFMVQFSHSHLTTGKTIALTIQTFVSKVMSLLFYMLSRFVIAFLPRSKCLLISWLQSLLAVILKPKKMKIFIVSIVSPSIYHEVTGQDAMVLVFWILSFKPAFSLSSFTFIKRLFSSSLLSAIRVVSSVYLRLLIFLPAILCPACASSSLAFCMISLICGI